jgi:hypothetical protein
MHALDGGSALETGAHRTGASTARQGRARCKGGRLNLDLLRIRFLHRLEDKVGVRQYRKVAAHDVVLGLFATPVEALDEMLGLEVARAHANFRAADALLRAILKQHRVAKHDLWSTMLVLAFFPAISDLARRARSFVHDEDERRVLIIEGFLDGAAQLKPLDTVDRIPMRLCQGMRRHAFREIYNRVAERRVLRELVTAAFDRRRIEPFVRGRSEAQAHPIEDGLSVEKMIEILAKNAPAALEVLQSEEPSLRALTRALRPDLSPPEQERLYQRWKRRYARAAERGELESLPPWWEAITQPEQEGNEHERLAKSKGANGEARGRNLPPTRE